MQDRPSAHELCVASLEALEGVLIPSLPAHLKRQAAMVVQSLRMVQRHLQSADADALEERDLLRGVVPAGPDASIAEMNWLLVEKIRAGRFADAEDLKRVSEAVRLLNILKLRESNPRFLNRSS